MGRHRASRLPKFCRASSAGKGWHNATGIASSASTVTRKKTRKKKRKGHLASKANGSLVKCRYCGCKVRASHIRAHALNLCPKRPGREDKIGTRVETLGSTDSSTQARLAYGRGIVLRPVGGIKPGSHRDGT